MLCTCVQAEKDLYVLLLLITTRKTFGPPSTRASIAMDGGLGRREGAQHDVSVLPVPDHPRQPGTFGCFSPTHLSTIEAFCRPDAGPGAEDAKLRDRSAPDVCPIAILRGLLL